MFSALRAMCIENHNAKVIIDTLNNNIFHTRLAYQLEKIKPSKFIYSHRLESKTLLHDTLFL